MQNSSILHNWMKNENAITNWLYVHEEELIDIAQYVWEHPETAYEEKLSSKCLGTYLEKQGFTVEWGTAGIETAFSAKCGTGRPYIGFLAEYDALAEIGQSFWNSGYRCSLCTQGRIKRRNNLCLWMSCRRDFVRENFYEQ